MPYSNEPATAPLIEPSPPMITTTSECSSHWPSAPVATPANEATITPPIPARNDPTKNVTANTIPTLIPRARTIDWSATPARMTMPIRVRLSHSHSRAPTTIEIPRMNSRLVA